MTLALASPAPGRKRRPQLANILLGSYPTDEGRWSQRTGRVSDIASVTYEPDSGWSCSCNRDRVDIGTIGWIARHGDGPIPTLGGVIICTGDPYPVDEEDPWGNPILDHNGDQLVEWYVPGRLYGGLAVPGTRIARSGWAPTRSPWGKQAVRQFQNGERIDPGDLAGLLRAVGPAVRRTVALEYHEVTGEWPGWADD